MRWGRLTLPQTRGPKRRGTYSAFCGAVQLFEILQRGFDTPLTSTLVAGLFDAGCLVRHPGSASAQDTQGQMVEYISPPSKYRTPRQFTRHLPAARRVRPFQLSLPTAIPLVFVGAIATVLLGCLSSIARPAQASPISTSVGSPAVVSPSALGKKPTRKNAARLQSPYAGTGAFVVAVSGCANGAFQIPPATAERPTEPAPER